MAYGVCKLYKKYLYIKKIYIFTCVYKIIQIEVRSENSKDQFSITKIGFDFILNAYLFYDVLIF